MNFLPIAVIGYAIYGGATLIDKILLNKPLPHPIVYTFYISLMGLATILLIPFGLELNFQVILYGAISGVFGNLALLTYFTSLKSGEASVVSPIVGVLNPLFALILSVIFLNELLAGRQIMGMFILLLGAIILTLNQLFKVRLNKQLLVMALSGLFFAFAYIFLRETFLTSNFVTGLVVSRVTGGVLAFSFLFFPKIRSQIFDSRLTKNHFANHTSYLLILGQIMGAAGGLLIAFAVSLQNPALVNSLFGVQYLVIMAAALILYERHSHILDETLTAKVLTRKIIAIFILSFGLYLLT